MKENLKPQSYEEWAKTRPKSPETAEIEAQVRQEQQERDERERQKRGQIEALKATVTNQIKHAAGSPFSSLLAAVECIALLTDDPAWFEGLRAEIEAIEPPAQQVALFADQAEATLTRAKELQHKHAAGEKRRALALRKYAQELYNATSDTVRAFENLERLAGHGEM